MNNPGFFARVGLALKVLFDAVLAGQVQGALSADAPVEEAPTPEPEPVAPPAADNRPALQLLGALQRDGRLVDFLKEEIDGAADADIGAAARVIHAGCRKVLDKYFTIEEIWPGPEGSRVTVDEGFDPMRVQLTGNVVGDPPFSGTLQHHGWRVSDTRMPTLSEAQDASIVAPAEVEL
jgi:hypothetical protein